MLGYLSSHFFFYFMKPRLFDPVFKEGGKTLPQGEYWRSFIIAACLSVIGILQVLAAYIYVETYYTIPAAWTASIREICKDARKTELFHHQNMAHSGHLVFLPGIFFWQAVKHSA